MGFGMAFGRRCSGRCGCGGPLCTVTYTLHGCAIGTVANPLEGASVALTGPSPGTGVVTLGPSDASGVAAGSIECGTYTRVASGPAGQHYADSSGSLTVTSGSTSQTITLVPASGYCCCDCGPPVPDGGTIAYDVSGYWDDTRIDDYINENSVPNDPDIFLAYTCSDWRNVFGDEFFACNFFNSYPCTFTSSFTRLELSLIGDYRTGTFAVSGCVASGSPNVLQFRATTTTRNYTVTFTAYDACSMTYADGTPLINDYYINMELLMLCGEGNAVGWTTTSRTCSPFSKSVENFYGDTMTWTKS